jgi:penicillin-binding protein A
MNTQVRRVAIGIFVLFGLLFVNLNYIQVLQADELANDNRNTRGLIREYEIRRGLMIAGDGVTDIARVEQTDGTLRYLRQYTDGPLFAHITGYHSVVYGRSELERSFNDFLIGAAPETFTRNLADLLAGRERAGDDLILTVQPSVQAAAREALGDRRGAVVALEPRTGGILALWSSPTYDPNRLATHSSAEANAYWAELNADAGRPLVNRGAREWYPPGSTFKLVTTAAALEHGIQPDQTFPDPVEQELPQTTSTIRNFGRGTCNQGNPITLTRALEVSCNTTFAQIGLELGADVLIDTAEAFGLNHTLVDDQIPNILDSRMPRELNPPQTAQSAIGQFDVRTTPLQMALVASTIANNGVLMTPHIVRQVADERSSPVAVLGPDPLVLSGRSDAQAISQQTAQHLRDMMIGVVERGTGGGAAIPGVRVAGKTGTAETGQGPPTVWFVGFAPAEDPRVAVAVVVEEGGGVGDEATGGRIAAPIAQAVMAAVAMEPAEPPEPPEHRSEPPPDETRTPAPWMRRPLSAATGGSSPTATSCAGWSARAAWPTWSSPTTPSSTARWP